MQYCSLQHWTLLLKNRLLTRKTCHLSLACRELLVHCTCSGHFISALCSQWRMQWQPTPVVLPGKSHGKSLLQEEPGRLQFMGSLGVGHDRVTSLSLFTFMHWRRKWQPTPVFLPGKSQRRRSLVGCHLWSRTELDMTEAT